VRVAGNRATQRRIPALDDLLREYFPVLKQYLSYRFRLSEHEADDLLQNFVVHKVLNGELLARADRNRGHFRVLLVTSLARYVISEFRKANAQKRAPDHGAMPIDDNSSNQPVFPSETPKSELDFVFARAVFSEAVRRMRIECRSADRQDLMGIFEARFLRPLQQGVEPVSNEELMHRYEFKSSAEISNALTTAKRMFGRNFRSVVADYVPHKHRIDTEIRDLKNILAET